MWAAVHFRCRLASVLPSPAISTAHPLGPLALILYTGLRAYHDDSAGPSNFAASTMSRDIWKVNQGLPALPVEILEVLHLRLLDFVLLRPYPRRICRNQLYIYQALLGKKLVYIMRDFESRIDPDDMT